MRPRAISLLCLLLVIWDASMLMWALSLFVQVSSKASVFFLLSSLLVLLSLWGLWRMRRWGVYLFVGLWGNSLFTQYSAFDPTDHHLTSTVSWLILAIYWVVVLPYWSLLNRPRVADAV